MGTKYLPGNEGKRWIPPTSYRSKTCRWIIFWNNVSDDTNRVRNPFESLVSINLSKPNTRRESTDPADGFSVTLQYLVTGNAFSTICHSYRMSNASVGRIVKGTCNVLWKRLSEEGFIKQADSTTGWINIAKEHEKYCNFPNCVCAIDGKHDTI